MPEPPDRLFVVGSMFKSVALAGITLSHLVIDRARWDHQYGWTDDGGADW